VGKCRNGKIEICCKDATVTTFPLAVGFWKTNAQRTRCLFAEDCRCIRSQVQNRGERKKKMVYKKVV